MGIMMQRFINDLITAGCFTVVYGFVLYWAIKRSLKKKEKG